MVSETVKCQVSDWNYVGCRTPYMLIYSRWRPENPIWVFGFEYGDTSQWSSAWDYNQCGCQPLTLSAHYTVISKNGTHPQRCRAHNAKQGFVWSTMFVKRPYATKTLGQCTPSTEDSTSILNWAQNAFAFVNWRYAPQKLRINKNLCTPSTETQHTLNS